MPRRGSSGPPGAGGRSADPAPAARPRAARASRPAAAASTSPCSQRALPDREVGVLDRQLGQRRAARPGAKARVERRQLARKHAHRPAVGDDVVHRQRGARGPPRRGAAAAPAAAARGADRTGAAPPPSRLPRHLALAAIRGEPAQIDQRQAASAAGRIDLHRLARPASGRRSAAPRAGARSRRALRGEGRQVEARRGGGRPAACCRPGSPGSSWSRNQSRCWANDSGSGPLRGRRLERRARRDRLQPASAGRPRGQPGHGRRLEERPQRQLDPERRPDPRRHPGRQQRVAAQLEEVVVRADRLAPQHLAPDRRQHLLHRAAGRRGVADPRPPRRRRRQGPPVYLAVRSQRQRLQTDEGRRHHVLRQPARRKRPQLTPVGHVRPAATR